MELYIFNFQVSDKGFPNEEEEKLSTKNITLEIWDVNDEFPIFIKPLETVFVSDVSTYISRFSIFQKLFASRWREVYSFLGIGGP